MGEKDITEKILEDHNDVFADIINGLVFAGEQKILAESLENTAVHSQYKADDEKVHELERDIAKYWKDGEVELAICGIENQSSVEKYMPFRVMEYDGTAYRSQLQKSRKEILPVMTIVLYYGTEHHWYAKKNIKALMKIPDGMEKYINDYKIQIFEVAWLTEEEIERFQSDFRIVANFFAQKRKNKDYIPDDPTEIRHVDEVLKLSFASPLFQLKGGTLGLPTIAGGGVGAAHLDLAQGAVVLGIVIGAAVDSTLNIGIAALFVIHLKDLLLWTVLV
mgnify:CR=1 FL=1